MGKSALRSPLKVLAATSVAIFSLLTVFTSTAAWFDSRRTLDNGGDNFEVQSLSGRLQSVTFHQSTNRNYNDAGTALDSVTFDSNPIGSITYNWNANTASFVPTSEGQASVSLPQYDPLNREQPLLLLFHFDQAYTTTGPSIHIDASTEAPGFLGEKGDDAVPTYNLNSESVIYKTKTVNATTINYYWMSSVVQFYNTTLADDNYGWEYAMNSDYAEDNPLLPELKSTNQPFATANNETDINSFNNRITLFSSKNGQTIKNVAVVVDYFPDCIEYIYSTYLGDYTLETTYDGILHFWCDWIMEVF